MQYRARLKLGMDRSSEREPEKAQKEETTKKRDYLRNDHSYTVWEFVSLGVTAGTFNLRNRRGALVKDVPNIAARGGKPPEEGEKVMVGYYNSNYNDPFCIYPALCTGAGPGGISLEHRVFNPQIGDQFGLGAGYLRDLASPPANGIRSLIWEMSPPLSDGQWEPSTLKIGVNSKGDLFISVMQFVFIMENGDRRDTLVHYLYVINPITGQTKFSAPIKTYNRGFGEWNLENGPDYDVWLGIYRPDSVILWVPELDVYVFQDAHFIEEIKRFNTSSRNHDVDYRVDTSMRTELLLLSEEGEVLATFNEDFLGGRLANATAKGRIFFDGPAVSEWALEHSEEEGWTLNKITTWREPSPEAITRNHVLEQFSWSYDSSFEYTVKSITENGLPIIIRRRRELSSGATTSIHEGDEASFVGHTSSFPNSFSDPLNSRSVVLYSLCNHYISVRWTPETELTGSISTPAWNSLWAYEWGPAEAGDYVFGGWGDSSGTLVSGPNSLSGLSGPIEIRNFDGDSIPLTNSRANVTIWTRSGLLINNRSLYTDREHARTEDGFSNWVTPGLSGISGSGMLTFRDGLKPELPVVKEIPIDFSIVGGVYPVTASNEEGGWLFLCRTLVAEPGYMVKWYKENEEWVFEHGPITEPVMQSGFNSSYQHLVPIENKFFHVLVSGNIRLFRYH